MTTSPTMVSILGQLQAILQQEQAEVYFVGGCVRDLLMDRPLHDLDLVVAGDAVALARRAADAFHGAFVLLDEQNAVARTVLRGPAGSPTTEIDFARMRGPDLQADLAARDLTVNAMAMRPADFRSHAAGRTTQPAVIDPLGGQEDLRAGRLRAISPQALHDDPLRTMRAVRFAAELDFVLDLQTARWIRQSAHLLADVSWERIRDELFRLLACPHAAPYLPLLDELQLLPQVIPELEVAREAPGLDLLWEKVCCLEWIAATLEEHAPPSREGRYWVPAGWQADLSLELPYVLQLRRYLHERIADRRSRLVLLKLAALLRFGDAPAPARADMAQGIARRLRLSAREVLSLRTAVAVRAIPDPNASGVTARLAVYRLYRDAGTIATGLLLLSLAEDLAAAGRDLDKDWWASRVGQVCRVLTMRYQDAPQVIDPPHLLDGNELMHVLGLPPGPLIGELLEGIREAQAAGEVQTREGALAWARRKLQALQRT